MIKNRIKKTIRKTVVGFALLAGIVVAGGNPASAAIVPGTVDANNNPLLTDTPYFMYVSTKDDGVNGQTRTAVDYDRWLTQDFLFAQNLNDESPPMKVTFTQSQRGGTQIRVVDYAPGNDRDYLMFDPAWGFPVIGNPSADGDYRMSHWTLRDGPIVTNNGRQEYGNFITNNYLEANGWASRLKAFSPGGWLYVTGSSNRPSEDWDVFVFHPAGL
ncbi:hypothetical protein BK704_35400 [[Bacillus thuringiensis] serovar konkukian]|nr:hypothetical protein [Bacillus thuringiensis]MED1304012.1 hypothetical protein [Bacillus pacificus]OUA91307.1 hypothetical protein BK704_35400 [[Bacillus thuringiensis] serovar konkukian]